MGQSARLSRLEKRAGNQNRLYFIVFGRTLMERDALVEAALERSEIRAGDLVERVPWTLETAPPAPRWIGSRSMLSADEDAMMGELCERRLAALKASLAAEGVPATSPPSDERFGVLGEHELHADILRFVPPEAVDIDCWS